MARKRAASWRTVPVRCVLHCRGHVRAGGNTLQNVCGGVVRICAALCRYLAVIAGDAGMVCGSPHRNRSVTAVRAPRSEVKIYTVGGAVRDELLGLPVSDHDYVV